MGRNRKKSGAGSVEATRYDVFGNALPEAGAAQPSASSEFEANGVIKTQDLPEGWEAAGFGGQRSLRGGVDGQLPDGRLITIKNQGIGGNVIVNIDGIDYYYPVENMRDYVVDPDLARLGRRTTPALIEDMTVFDYERLIPEVMRAVQQWNERQQQITLRVGEQERARLNSQWNDQTIGAYSRTLPSKSPNESDDEYIARLKQDAAQRAQAFSRIDASLLHGMNARNISDWLSIYRNDLQAIADREFRMLESLSPKARRAARDYLYGQMAQIIRIGGMVETIADQRNTLGNKTSIGMPIRGSYPSKALQKSKMMSFAERSRQVQQRTYKRMREMVQDALEYRIGRGTRDASFTLDEIKELVQQPKVKF
jgi:hypothetical protein